MTPAPEPAAAVPPPAVTLRRLFLTLFLRGRSARGLRRSHAPSSIGGRLGWTLFTYALFGLVALAFVNGSVFVLSATLHAMTFLLLVMFVAASSGEILFNQEEADILLHRPVAPRSLLTAKALVLVEVSLWLAGTLNLFTFFVGASRGGWLFPIAHALSITLEAVFATSCVVLAYQLCLRWFGRERLEGLMTTAQVGVALCATLGGQLIGPLMHQFEGRNELVLDRWWVGLAPPLWFAAIDDALAGSGGAASWLLAGLACAATLAAAGVGLGKLAADYQRGLQVLSENPGSPRSHADRRWFDVLVNSPPLSWWLRDPVSRAAFLLTAAYLVRDRDTKLRLYPGLAPTLVMPLIFLLRTGQDGTGRFGVALAGSMLGMVPALALGVIKYSQQWQASDIFQAAPLPGPALLFRGARWAVLVVLTLPMCVVVGVLAWLVSARAGDLALLLPGLLALPAYVVMPCLDGSAAPFSCPADEARAARGGARMLGAVAVSVLISLLGIWAAAEGWLGWLLLVEALAVVTVCLVLRPGLASVRWAALE